MIYSSVFSFQIKVRASLLFITCLQNVMGWWCFNEGVTGVLQEVTNLSFTIIRCFEDLKIYLFKVFKFEVTAGLNDF